MDAIAQTLTPNDLARGLWPRTLDELRAFVGLASKTAKPTVDVSALVDDMFAQIGQVADEMLLSAIEQRTGSEFRATVREVFNDYVHVMRAKSDILRVVLRNDVERTERLIHSSLAELEADFREQGMQRFGAVINEQAMFTVWTLRKTASMIWKLRDTENGRTEISDGEKEAHDQLNAQFALYSAWAQFHLACLNAAVRLDKPIYPDVQCEMVDGLRAMVNAHGYARQIVEIWMPSTDEVPMAPYAWDAEDEELMQSSMRDLESDES